MGALQSRLEALLGGIGREFAAVPSSFSGVKIGLDAGQYAVKVAALDTRKKRILYLGQAEVFPERERRDQVLKPKELFENIYPAIQIFDKKIPGFKNNIISMIQGEETVSGYIELPPAQLSKKELDLAVQSRVLEHLPMGIEHFSVSYLPVPPLDKNSGKTSYFFAAANKASVDEVSAAMKQQGMSLQGMEIPALALAREITLNRKPEPDSFVALVNVGFHLTQVVIIRDGYPYYAREFALAGRDFTYAFAMLDQIPWKQAEQVKLTYDVQERGVALEPFLVGWLDEIKQTLRYFKNRIGKGAEAKRVVLSGGSAVMKNLDRLLAEHLAMDVAIDSWHNLECPQRFAGESAPAFKIAAGLAAEV